MYLYRSDIEKLKEWKNGADRKPLIVEGARQVGKTELLGRFCKEYKNSVFVNLEQDEQAAKIFDGSFEPERIISRLSLHANQEITPGETLIVIDEAQQNTRALTALKYFSESAPEYHIIAAGSLLGLTLHKGVSFPVGKVQHLKIFPLSFREFLIATNKDKLAEAIESGDFELIAPFHDAVNELLRVYMIVGGMPAAVKKYVEDKSLLNVRSVQKDILADYEHDFSNHADNSDVPKIREIFDIIPSVLAKENKKFMFSMIKKSARAREYEDALLWLTDAGIATKVNRVKKVGLPLSAYKDLNSFKVFLVDVGLLGAKAGLKPETIYDEENFTEFKGTMAEQIIFQELAAKRIETYYYSADESNAEIDFIIDGKNGLAPIEVKSGTNLSSHSLTELLKAKPRITGYKFSELPYRDSGQTINMPLYGAGSLS